MSTSKLLTSLTTPSTERLADKGMRPSRRGLAVRTDIRAGAWDDIDDQLSAFWNQLRNSVNASGGANAPTKV